MTDFQALVTGAIAGALMKAGADDGHLLIDVDVGVDSEGNYTNQIEVTGRESGEELLVVVTPRYSTPESVASSMEQATAAMKRFAEIWNERSTK